MNKSTLHLLLPLTVVAFNAVDVSYVNLVFNFSTRWILLGVLFVVVLLKGQLFSIYRSKFGFWLAIYIVWCISSTYWSEIPRLSFLKTGALAISVTALGGAGYFWGISERDHRTLDFLFPILLLTLLSAFHQNNGYAIGTVTVYQGLTGNPNMLGALVAMSSPYALWHLFLAWRHQSKTFPIWGAINAALLIVLVFSGSRASLLVILITIFVGVMAMSPGKRFAIATTAGFVLLAGLVAVPALKGGIYERFVIKGASGTTEDAILFSRKKVWSESYEQAEKGGLIGGGYGVTIGNSNFIGLITANRYGREKGNAQLAIWEETGEIGLGLYTVAIIFLFKELLSGMRRIRDYETRVEFGLLFGAVLGFLAQSVFEAWWVAPGSPESSFFWPVVGAAYGLMRRVSKRQHQFKAARRSVYANPRRAFPHQA